MSNPPYSTLYEMKVIPGKGRGLVAKQALQRGTMVFEDEPLFAPGKPFKDPAEIRKVGDRRRQSKELFDRRVGAWHWDLVLDDLHNAFNDSSPGGQTDVRRAREMGIYRTNCVPTRLGEETVFRILSLVNHSCIPNAVYSYHAHPPCARLHLVCNVSPGEEITRDYTAFSKGNRFTGMKERYGFECSCCLCRQKISILTLRNTQLKCLDEDPCQCDLHRQPPLERYRLLGLRIAMLMKEEKCHHGSLFNLAAMACLLAAKYGDLKRSKLLGIWMIHHLVRGCREERVAAPRARLMTSHPYEFVTRGSSKDWDTSVNVMPREHTPFENHLWLWRVDDLRQQRFPQIPYQVASNFHGALSPAEQKRAESLRTESPLNQGNMYVLGNAREE